MRRSLLRYSPRAGDRMYTVDASVWVNGFDQREAGHATSRQLLQALRTRALPIIVPNLVLAEVAGAISRTRNDPVRAEAFATTLGRLPNVTVVALDVALGDQARVLAAQYGLRGADAVYAAVAQQAVGPQWVLASQHPSPTRPSWNISIDTLAQTFISSCRPLLP
jgi:predicted nucleic acid-binding protein